MTLLETALKTCLTKTCCVTRSLDNFSPKVREEIITMMNHPAVFSSVAVELFNNELPTGATPVSETSMRRHRAGKCGCPKNDLT